MNTPAMEELEVIEKEEVAIEEWAASGKSPLRSVALRDPRR